MTVKELMEKLQRCPADAEVKVETSKAPRQDTKIRYLLRPCGRVAELYVILLLEI